MSMKLTKGKFIEKTGIPANKDYYNADNVVDVMIDLADKINELVDWVNQQKVIKK